MPGGVRHKQLHDIFWFLPVITGAVLLYYWWPPLGEDILLVLTIPPGYYFGNFMDPDLDLPMNTVAKKRWKNIVLWPMFLWWSVYSKLAKLLGGHRSFLTHAPVISTWIRFVWLLIPVMLIFVLIDIPWLHYEVLQYGLWGLFIGVSISDIVHIFFDLVS
jgi:uncharacterized metal-binding protein